MADDIAERVKAIIVRELGVDAGEVTPGALLADDLGADSLDVVAVTTAVEDAFDINIEDDDMWEMLTVADVTERVAKSLY